MIRVFKVLIPLAMSLYCVISPADVTEIILDKTTESSDKCQYSDKNGQPLGTLSELTPFMILFTVNGSSSGYIPAGDKQGPYGGSFQLFTNDKAFVHVYGFVNKLRNQLYGPNKSLCPDKMAAIIIVK